ncbi:MAG: neutral/alkaline non-lysosomal ceramidase N-terminal domain-containing protein [Isosphaeraceae bacterium]
MLLVRRTALLSLLTLILTTGAPASAEGWKAGVARVSITPTQPTWMAGYGSRDHPSEGALHELWAKALVLEDPAGKRLLLVTLDVCGIDRATSLEIREAIRAAHQLPLERICLASSHTHCGPVIGENLITMYPMNEEQRGVVRAYTRTFVEKVKKVASSALASLTPVDVAWGNGRADFAVNRRNNKEPDVPKLRQANALEGPVDHDVPVLRVRGLDGRNRAIVVGYACHCTVLSFSKFCGDYAGFAQVNLEKLYPGCQAMFVAGCGADQNPLPRRTVELATTYGSQLSEAALRVVETPMWPVQGSSEARYEEIPLRLGELPTAEQLRTEAASKNFPLASRARSLLARLEHDGKLASEYPYPVQIWRFGGLTWVLLGGEVVVDYSLRFKRNMGGSRTWVSSYCNDVMAYIPSLRVLKEGGYEGATSMIPYGLPTSWSTAVEEQVVDSVTRLARPAGARESAKAAGPRR